ncbi:hypothetical protein PC119_g24828 [Phytophthora cactorum]|uniref:Uncharacterized protein n=1 Tax=Phytophthora cactorum TaxID=29920 RepID=A0A8T0Y8D6_9STRA|nr:hypothetical protein PC112_g18678 [Phytophthora cactorum]KAG2805635.1 hypothetical protein PC111_g17717 [Phytophthora cactorum]KAG2843303.1 hypothetical protein PC113_g18627 [Phytophthora cactorum]KAG2907533.1 hypothetical protein PC117_g20186 [Phytophthora cactorum]KAG2966091.1 hypothetical protein PC119_g24828 [Phytophthora cactorum]
MGRRTGHLIIDYSIECCLYKNQPKYRDLGPEASLLAAVQRSDRRRVGSYGCNRKKKSCQRHIKHSVPGGPISRA